jgi:hypothetical protein
MRFHYFLWTLIFAIVVIILMVPGLSHGTMIAVYSRPGMSFSAEEAATCAGALRLDPAAPVDERFLVRVSDSSVLSSEFSVPPQVSAYFWSDQTFEHDGFVMEGNGATFESGSLPAAVAEATDIAADTAEGTVRIGGAGAWKSEFQGASLESKRIQLRYTLSGPGRVSVEAYGLDGRSLGRWNWEEGSSGSYRRSVELGRAPPGVFLLRWNHGNREGVRRLVAKD